MRNKKELLFEYEKYSQAYLDRALQHLQSFDQHSDVASFFYAVLELRLGIEARLYEYIDPTFKSLGLDSSSLKEYVATKLLKALIAADEDSDKRVTLRISQEGSNRSIGAMEFTPVTKELAVMHGKLGELLHFKFFRNNKHWYFKDKVYANSGKTLVNYREFLDKVLEELKEATRGNLLSNPRFTVLVKDIVSDKEG